MAEKVNVYEERVVGTRYLDESGAIAGVVIFDIAYLVREPDNPEDPNAIRVQSAGGAPLGYLTRYIAKAVAPKLDNLATPVPATVIGIKGYVSGNLSGLFVRFELA